VDLLSATRSEGVGLIVRAISFRDFQPMWSQMTNVTDGQADRRTTCDPKTAHMHLSALRGNEMENPIKSPVIYKDGSSCQRHLHRRRITGRGRGRWGGLSFCKFFWCSLFGVQVPFFWSRKPLEVRIATLDSRLVMVREERLETGEAGQMRERKA